MKKYIMTMAVLLIAVAVNAKTLVAYYSYTNNVESIVNDLRTKIECDVVEIEPADKGLDYAANNYAIGSQLLNAIKANPDDASSYPAIDGVDIDLDDYSTIIIACPLWWGQMAAPFQTFLFHYGAQMAGKNIGVIISSASSGISGVVADAKRLIPDGKFLEPNLWIRSSQTPNATLLISTWLSDINYNELTSAMTSVGPDKDLEVVLSQGVLSVNGDFNNLAIYNISGYKVLETSDVPIDLSGLQNGIYMARIERGTQIKIEKMVIR